MKKLIVLCIILLSTSVVKSQVLSWTGESNLAYSLYGYSSANADVNGDGYDDVIVGAYYFNNKGRVYIYKGSSVGLSITANWILEQNQLEGQFGFSVSGGDVNGDGYDDVIVGANSFDGDQVDEGKVFIYHGSSSGLSLVPNRILESNQSGSSFGNSVASAGDVNNDGYTDIVVGAPLYDNDQQDEGRVFVYHGSVTGISSTPNRTLENIQSNANFGISVSTAGDVNNDGYDDVIVGAKVYDNPNRDEGAAFAYYGSSTGLPTLYNWFSGIYPLSFFSYFGTSVSTAGDVNGDGYDDVIIGANFFDNGKTDEGKVFVYQGSIIGLSLVANWTAESNQPYARFGTSVSTAGDVNNDGYDDVIVAASFYDNGQADEGSAFIYYGSSSGPSLLANWTAESNQVLACLSTVSTAGDVNNDGYDDVIVGSYIFDNGQIDEGRAYVYNGISTKTLNLTTFIQGMYNPTTNLTVSDTVRVFLRNTVAPYVIIDSAKAYMNSSGTGIFKFSRISNGVNYFLQTKHRNGLETWSASGQSFLGNVLTYNFTTAANKAYGSNMKQIDTSPVRYGIYSGDVNQDGTIDGSDIIKVSNAATQFESGYTINDLNGDNFVDGNDISIAHNNAVDFVTVIRP